MEKNIWKNLGAQPQGGQDDSFSFKSRSSMISEPQVVSANQTSPGFIEDLDKPSTWKPDPEAEQTAAPTSTNTTALNHIIGELIMASNGQPFMDLDAARVKAARLERDLGETSQIVNVEGGFAIQILPLIKQSVISRNEDPSDAWSVRRSKRSVNDVDFEQEGSADVKEDPRLQKKNVVIRPAIRSQFLHIVLGGIVVAIGFFPERSLILTMGHATAVDLARHINWLSLCKFVSWIMWAFGGLLLGKALAVRQMTRYEITQNYVMTKYWTNNFGKLKYSQTKTMFGNILTTEIDQNLIGRLFDFGTVKLETAGDVDPKLINIARPAAIQSIIEKRKIGNERR